MNPDILYQLKKYMLYVSSFFFVLFTIHLSYIYVSHDAETQAQEGGTISEALIGGFPHFNPLVLSNDHNAYINDLLYRSMLEYSTETENFVSDLVSCNLDNLLYIECVLESNLSWSDGSSITTDDIAATLKIIKETKVNSVLSALLEETKISTTSDTITFQNETKDINFLSVFLQPILSQRSIEKLDSENISGKFSEIGGVYSGRFRLINISQDETVGITKLTLGKNDNYHNNPLFINFLILNLFEDESHFLKNKNSFNIFNDKNSLIGNSIPRLQAHEYTLSKFTSVFYNSELLESNFRKFIAQNIKREEIIDELGTSNVLPALNPFLSESIIDPENTDFNLDSYLVQKGFYPKNVIVTAAKEKQLNDDNLISNEAQIQKNRKTQSDLSTIISPTQKKYNFTSEDNILLTGNVRPDVTEVYVNDYKLTGFSQGDIVFNYRLLEAYDSISKGENSYKIFFGTDSGKEFVEEVVYIYEEDEDTLNQIQESYFNDEIATPVLTSTGPINTELTVSESLMLEDDLYYNTKGEPFSIRLLYTSGDPLIGKSAAIIKEKLEQLGIAITSQEVSLSAVASGLRNESLVYDIFVLGIDLGYFESNIFPYFHSSQIANGYNISNYKKLSLDILLEELKSNNLSVTKRNELEEKMLEIIGQETLLTVLYTPKVHLLVDRNIQDFVLPSYMPNMSHRLFPLNKSYLTEKNIFQWSNKGPRGFIRYIFSRISS